MTKKETKTRLRQIWIDTLKYYVTDDGKDAGKRGLSENNDCVYRTKDGSMCAIGRILPDSVHKMIDTEFIDGEVSYVVNRFLLKYTNDASTKDIEFMKFMQKHKKMFEYMQEWHDSNKMFREDNIFKSEIHSSYDEKINNYIDSI